MKKKVFIFAILLLSFISFGFSTGSISCSIRDGVCQGAEVPFLYANKNFVDTSGNPLNVLSSNSAFSSSTEYDKIVCCKSNLGKGDLETFYVDGVTCPGDEKVVDLVHLTSPSNARVGIRKIIIDTFATPSSEYNFNISHYSKTLCVKIPDAYSSFSLKASNRDLSSVGYSCMFKLSSLTNGVLSSCNSTFNGGNQYYFTIWGRLNENENSLQCNNDCTSKLDNRVYTMCGEKILGCEGIPSDCNGALLGSWINNGTADIQCSSPWDGHRTKQLSDSGINVSSSSSDCENIIVKKFPVVTKSYHEGVNMLMYICSK